MTTRERLKEYSSPLNFAQVAKELGVSRERIRQLAIELGLYTSQPRQQKVEIHCTYCGKVVKRSLSSLKGKLRPQCALRCPARSVTITCLWCGKEKRIPRSQFLEGLKAKHGVTNDFCSRPCFYAARSEGFRIWKRFRKAIMAEIAEAGATTGPNDLAPKERPVCPEVIIAET